MSARDYSVTFPYGAISAPYSPSSPHRGNDRPCPSGTPVIIGDTTIGWTGMTGWADGPHLHTQAGTDEWCQKTFNPAPCEFQPGTVVHWGWADQWGNYVIIRTAAGYTCYAHLSQTNVSIGQVINGSITGGSTVETIKSMYWRLVGREADAGGITHYTKQVADRGWEFVYNDLKNSGEGQRDWDRRNPTRVASLEAQLSAVQQALANEQAKPPKEVIKEVTKVVTEYVDRPVPAPVDEKQVVENWLVKLWNSLFKK